MWPAGTSELRKAILQWSAEFREGKLSVEDVHDRFSQISEGAVQGDGRLERAVVSAKQELDAIRFGMCESGQAGEISRIFRDMEEITREQM